jgi:hypothetical protein
MVQFRLVALAADDTPPADELAFRSARYNLQVLSLDIENLAPSDVLTAVIQQKDILKTLPCGIWNSERVIPPIRLLPEAERVINEASRYAPKIGRQQLIDAIMEHALYEYYDYRAIPRRDPESVKILQEIYGRIDVKIGREQEPCPVCDCR